MAIIDLPVGGKVEIRVSPPSSPGKLVYRGELRRSGASSPVCVKYTTAFDSEMPVSFLLDHPVDAYTIKIIASTPGDTAIPCTIRAQGFDLQGAPHDDEEVQTMSPPAGQIGRHVVFNVFLAPAQ